MGTAWGSNDLIYEEGRRTAAVCGLSSSQYSPGEEPISSPTDLGDARQDLRYAYHLIQIKEGNEYYQATMPIAGDRSSAKQRPLKRRMTRPEPISSYDDPTSGASIQNQSTLNNREVQRHPERGDKRT